MVHISDCDTDRNLCYYRADLGKCYERATKPEEAEVDGLTASGRAPLGKLSPMEFPLQPRLGNRGVI
jgi:hypothetical protein